MESHIGLQANEEKTDFDKLPGGVKEQSLLKRNSGFCVSWTMLITLMLYLNSGASVDDIGKYISSFGLTLPETDFLKLPLQQQQDLIQSKWATIQEELRTKHSARVVNLWTSPQTNPTYILQKHKELFCMLMFVLKYSMTLSDTPSDSPIEYLLRNTQLNKFKEIDIEVAKKDSQALQMLLDNVIVTPEILLTSDVPNLDTQLKDVHKEADETDNTCNTESLHKAKLKRTQQKKLVKDLIPAGVDNRFFDYRYSRKYIKYSV
jgi:hypothetical protein